MTKKLIIFFIIIFTLVSLPLTTIEVPEIVQDNENVLGEIVLAKATTQIKPITSNISSIKKPIAKKKVVAKKKAVKKKAPVKKKERLIVAPPLITPATAPHSGR